MDCRSLTGYHLRKAALYFEIVDPASGLPLPDGKTGEVVFTTLTRTDMPLIRYRTGDMAAFLAKPCPCGSVLRRLGHVRGRLSGRIGLGDGLSLDCADLDEALYEIPGLINHWAEVTDEEGMALLAMTLQVRHNEINVAQGLARPALERIAAVCAAVAAGTLGLGEIAITCESQPATGVAKRIIYDLRIGGTKK